MAVITFWNGTKEQVGNTSSAIALATQLAIEHNMKVLLMSTALNDNIVKQSFWYEKKKKNSLPFFMTDNSKIEKNGVEGLDRMLRSNKITPELITDYTRVVLTNRLEILVGVEGTDEQYKFIQKDYNKIVNFATKYYDMVIVDLDKELELSTINEVLIISDVIVAMVSQRADQIESVMQALKQNDIIKQSKTVLAIGKYLENTKYNAKNISRNLLKVKDTINTIPYNKLFFEASQEGKVIDMFLDFMRIKEKDDNYDFVQEIRRLIESINVTLKMQQQN